MDRWDVTAIVVGMAVFAAIALVVGDAGTTVGALIGIPGFVLALVHYRHGKRPAPNSPAPELLVEYRNVRMGDRPIVWHPQVASNPSRYIGCQLHVYLVNRGEGPAEAIEVRFDRLAASDVWNESGNFAEDVDTAVHPPRFEGRSRILYPGREWCIARLSWHTSPPRGTAVWEAFARGMQPKEGVVRIDVLDEPPPELQAQ